MSYILKPCPFCGGEAEFSVGKTGDGKDWHYIECVDCSTVGPRVNYADHNIRLKEALADAWNGRAAKDAEIAKLREALKDAADQLALVHDDAFKQAIGYGLVTTDGRAFSCSQLNMCSTAADRARKVLKEASDDSV